MDGNFWFKRAFSALIRYALFKVVLIMAKQRIEVVIMIRDNVVTIKIEEVNSGQKMYIGDQKLGKLWAYLWSLYIPV